MVTLQIFFILSVFYSIVSIWWRATNDCWPSRPVNMLALDFGMILFSILGLIEYAPTGNYFMVAVSAVCLASFGCTAADHGSQVFRGRPLFQPKTPTGQ